jgi:hypothetical protein
MAGHSKWANIQHRKGRQDAARSKLFSKLSKEITDRIEAGDLSMKPGWVRLSLHPTMTEDELRFIVGAIREVAENAGDWGKDYYYNQHTNEYHHMGYTDKDLSAFYRWFDLDRLP